MSTLVGRATIIGLGLIGGSLAKALKQAGWTVSGSDLDDRTVTAALEQGVIDSSDIDEDSNIVFVCTPVQSVADQVRRAANLTDCPITDVGSVKSVVAHELRDLPRFIPGHPMAGNEFSKLAGADPSLFHGATWILTPTDNTSESAYAAVHRVITSVLRAKVVSMEAERHDSLMAAVSHVPHFTAAALMLTAADAEVDRIVGLEIGADDYVTKPFSLRELIARIRGLLRRAALPPLNGSRQKQLRFDGWFVDPIRRQLYDPTNARVALTTHEFDILLAFCRNPGRVLAREELLGVTHAGLAGPIERSIDVHISRLRQKIERDVRDPVLIKTVRLGGYMFTADVEEV